MNRINPVIDELHDQMMVLSMRAYTYAQQNAELQAALEAANEEIRTLKEQHPQPED